MHKENKMAHYKVVEALSLEQLMLFVNRNIEAGFKCQGGVYINSSRSHYAQAMISED
jgi:hypothetical protein